MDLYQFTHTKIYLKKEIKDMPPASGVPLEEAKPLTVNQEPLSSEHTRGG